MDPSSNITPDRRIGRLIEFPILDAEEATAWYEQQQPGLGVEFLLELDVAIERAAEMPLAFPPLDACDDLQRSELVDEGAKVLPRKISMTGKAAA